MKHLYIWLRNATFTIFITVMSVLFGIMPVHAARLTNDTTKIATKSLMPAPKAKSVSDKKEPTQKPSASTLIKRRKLLAVSLVKLNNLMLLAASRAGDAARITKALDRGAKINIYNTQLQTPLMLAIQSGYTPSVQLLLNAGASTSIRDKMGNSAIDYALQTGNQEIIKLVVPADQIRTATQTDRLDVADDKQDNA